jgi:hypothetical protein
MYIRGNVTDSNGDPLSGAVVSLLSTSYAVTGPLGNYSFFAPGIAGDPGCPAGDTYIFVDAIGYQQASRFIPVTCGNYGYNFSLSPAPDQSGIVFFDPAEKYVDPNESFAWEIYVDSGTRKIASYDIDIKWFKQYISSGLSVDTTIGNNGVEPGSDGFVSTVNTSERFINIKGTDPGGKGPGNDLHLCTIHFTAGPAPRKGVSVILTVNRLLDETGANVNSLMSTSGLLTIGDYTLGDVNDDGSIDILDALFTARYYVGLPVQQFNPAAADVDCNQKVTITDALFIAFYYVGIGYQFPCDL